MRFNGIPDRDRPPLLAPRVLGLGAHAESPTEISLALVTAPSASDTRSARAVKQSFRADIWDTPPPI
eukprot:498586-Hanusia_phi.AAC.1